MELMGLGTQFDGSKVSLKLKRSESFKKDLSYLVFDLEKLWVKEFNQAIKL